MDFLIFAVSTPSKKGIFNPGNEKEMFEILNLPKFRSIIG